MIPAIDISVRPLDAGDARLSYPLVRLTMPRVSFEDWNHTLHTAHISDSAPQMLGVFNAAGCLVGLLTAFHGEIEPFATTFMMAYQHDAIIGKAREAMSQACDLN